jgi:hypothetical protein
MFHVDIMKGFARLRDGSHDGWQDHTLAQTNTLFGTCVDGQPGPTCPYQTTRT